MGDGDRTAGLHSAAGKRCTTEPELSSTLPKRTMVKNSAASAPRRRARAGIISASRLLAPITLVGRSQPVGRNQDEVSDPLQRPPASASVARAEYAIAQAGNSIVLDQRHVFEGGRMMDDGLNLILGDDPPHWWPHPAPEARTWNDLGCHHRARGPLHERFGPADRSGRAGFQPFSNSTSRLGLSPIICRTSSDPIEPPAPVTITDLPVMMLRAKSVGSGRTGSRPSKIVGLDRPQVANGHAPGRARSFNGRQRARTRTLGRSHSQLLRARHWPSRGVHAPSPGTSRQQALLRPECSRTGAARPCARAMTTSRDPQKRIWRASVRRSRRVNDRTNGAVAARCFARSPEQQHDRSGAGKSKSSTSPQSRPASLRGDTRRRLPAATEVASLLAPTRLSTVAKHGIK